MADRAPRSGSQNDCGLSQGQWRGNQEGVRTIRRAVPANGIVGESERRDRRFEIQSRQRARQEFHRSQNEGRLEQIDASVARYLIQLDTADRQAAGCGDAEVPAAKTTRLKEKLARATHLKRRGPDFFLPSPCYSTTDQGTAAVACECLRSRRRSAERERPQVIFRRSTRG